MIDQSTRVPALKSGPLPPSYLTLDPESDDFLLSPVDVSDGLETSSFRPEFFDSDSRSRVYQFHIDVAMIPHGKHRHSLGIVQLKGWKTFRVR